MCAQRLVCFCEDEISINFRSAGLWGETRAVCHETAYHSVRLRWGSSIITKHDGLNNLIQLTTNRIVRLDFLFFLFSIFLIKTWGTVQCLWTKYQQIWTFRVFQNFFATQHCCHYLGLGTCGHTQVSKTFEGHLKVFSLHSLQQDRAPSLTLVSKTSAVPFAVTLFVVRSRRAAVMQKKAEKNCIYGYATGSFCTRAKE